MEHVPVLLGECLAGLDIKPDGIYVDGTLGRAGHALEIAKRLRGGRLIGIDRDALAIEEAKPVLREHLAKVTLIRGNFGGPRQYPGRGGRWEGGRDAVRPGRFLPPAGR